MEKLTPFQIRIAEAIRRLCDGNQADFARKLGVSAQLVGDYRRGVALPSLKHEGKLRDLLEIRDDREWMEIMYESKRIRDENDRALSRALDEAVRINLRPSPPRRPRRNPSGVRSISGGSDSQLPQCQVEPGTQWDDNQLIRCILSSLALLRRILMYPRHAIRCTTLSWVHQGFWPIPP